MGVTVSCNGPRTRELTKSAMKSRSREENPLFREFWVQIDWPSNPCCSVHSRGKGRGPGSRVGRHLGAMHSASIRRGDVMILTTELGRSTRHLYFTPKLTGSKP